MSQLVSNNLINNAMPIKEKAPKQELNRIKLLFKKNHNLVNYKDIVLFNMILDTDEYIISLYKNTSPWLMVFNKRGANIQPIVLKLFTNFKIATFYNNMEFKKIKDFFNLNLQNNKGLLSRLAETINKNIIINNANKSVPINVRQNVLRNQSKPEDINKVYFDGFVNHKENKNTGTTPVRSEFNSWKVQQILPSMIWAEIKNDINISVRFTDGQHSNYRLDEDEENILKQEVERLKKYK